MQTKSWKPKQNEQTVPLANVPQQRGAASEQAASANAQLDPTREVGQNEAEKEDVVDLWVKHAQQQRQRLAVQIIALARAERVIIFRRYDLIGRRGNRQSEFLGDLLATCFPNRNHAKPHAT